MCVKFFLASHFVQMQMGSKHGCGDVLLKMSVKGSYQNTKMMAAVQIIVRIGTL